MDPDESIWLPGPSSSRLGAAGMGSDESLLLETTPIFGRTKSSANEGKQEKEGRGRDEFRRDLLAFLDDDEEDGGLVKSQRCGEGEGKDGDSRNKEEGKEGRSGYGERSKKTALGITKEGRIKKHRPLPTSPPPSANPVRNTALARLLEKSRRTNEAAAALLEGKTTTFEPVKEVPHKEHKRHGSVEQTIGVRIEQERTVEVREVEISITHHHGGHEGKENGQRERREMRRESAVPTTSEKKDRKHDNPRHPPPSDHPAPPTVLPAQPLPRSSHASDLTSAPQPTASTPIPAPPPPPPQPEIIAPAPPVKAKSLFAALKSKRAPVVAKEAEKVVKVVERDVGMVPVVEKVEKVVPVVEVRERVAEPVQEAPPVKRVEMVEKVVGRPAVEVVEEPIREVKESVEVMKHQAQEQEQVREGALLPTSSSPMRRNEVAKHSPTADAARPASPNPAPREVEPESAQLEESPIIDTAVPKSADPMSPPKQAITTTAEPSPPRVGKSPVPEIVICADEVQVKETETREAEEDAEAEEMEERRRRVRTQTPAEIELQIEAAMSAWAVPVRIPEPKSTAPLAAKPDTRPPLIPEHHKRSKQLTVPSAPNLGRHNEPEAKPKSQTGREGPRNAELRPVAPPKAFTNPRPALGPQDVFMASSHVNALLQRRPREREVVASPSKIWTAVDAAMRATRKPVVEQKRPVINARANRSSGSSAARQSHVFEPDANGLALKQSLQAKALRSSTASIGGAVIPPIPRKASSVVRIPDFSKAHQAMENRVKKAVQAGHGRLTRVAVGRTPGRTSKMRMMERGEYDRANEEYQRQREAARQRYLLEKEERALAEELEWRKEHGFKANPLPNIL